MLLCGPSGMKRGAWHSWCSAEAFSGRPGGIPGGAVQPTLLAAPAAPVCRQGPPMRIVCPSPAELPAILTAVGDGRLLHTQRPLPGEAPHLPI